MRIMIGNWSPGRVLQQMEITEKEYQLLEDTMRGGSVLVQDQLTNRWFRLSMKFTQEILSIEFWHPEDKILALPRYSFRDCTGDLPDGVAMRFEGVIRESPKEFEERKELFNRHLPKL